MQGRFSPPLPHLHVHTAFDTSESTLRFSKLKSQPILHLQISPPKFVSGIQEKKTKQNSTFFACQRQTLQKSVSYFCSMETK